MDLRTLERHSQFLERELRRLSHMGGPKWHKLSTELTMTQIAIAKEKKKTEERMFNSSLLPEHLRHLVDDAPVAEANEKEILFGKPTPRMGCECGAHHTSFPDVHSHYCPKYRG